MLNQKHPRDRPLPMGYDYSDLIDPTLAACESCQISTPEQVDSALTQGEIDRLPAAPELLPLGNEEESL
jgi:hypothetical protein